MDSDSDLSADEARQYDCGHSEKSKTKQPLLARVRILQYAHVH